MAPLQALFVLTVALWDAGALLPLFPAVKQDYWGCPVLSSNPDRLQNDGAELPRGLLRRSAWQLYIKAFIRQIFLRVALFCVISVIIWCRNASPRFV